ncbi:protein serine/threonine kinase [Heterostelium album PN500]|uniref:Protein serine/threonine kinase n=1 Tax=Heterostelium pallidum (strain ATCC 26659 / Pp 5 / PN500) TaxID=670386 RepID=D3BM43_HETP5|nr:protein serine/threonine kinase [Heterostelium album PN500]EFA77644.1 protein serine/threonine kinase [Heterostelium album PN500]|eukprot:XP_020429772.1 protein serine/threonine kinase [Heterostelium album PN500]
MFSKTKSFKVCNLNSRTNSFTMLEGNDPQSSEEITVEQSDESALRMAFGGESSTSLTSSQTKKQLIANRMEEIKMTFKAIRASERVDLLFLLDCTGSMGEYIYQVKNDLVKLQVELKANYKNLDLKFGFIRYTDFDVEKPYSILDFTNSTLDFVTFVASIKDEGGDDCAEDMFGGMNLIKLMGWRKDSTRIVIHLADAPCHGEEYHDKPDNYPDGDPNGITLDSLMKDIISLDINYFFGHIIKPATSKMIDIFNKRLAILSKNMKTINTFDSKDISTLSTHLLKSVESSISSSRSTLTSQLVDKEPRIPKDYIIVKEVPYFPTLPLIPMQRIQFKIPNSLDACLDEKYEASSFSEEFEIKMAPYPFSQGGNRLAYHAVDKDGNRKVVKQSKYKGSSYNSMKRYLEEMECQTVAAKFAFDFNHLRSKQDINFTFAKVLVDKNNDQPQFYSVEKLIEGEYQKFNSNHGWLRKDEDGMNEIIQTFSHWTYQASKGKAMVVDIQGVKIDKGYLLTDPAIHCINVRRFGATNLGKPGMIKFFDTHKCNKHCRELKLVKPSFGILTKTTSSSPSSLNSISSINSTKVDFSNNN